MKPELEAAKSLIDIRANFPNVKIDKVLCDSGMFDVADIKEAFWAI